MRSPANWMHRLVLAGLFLASASAHAQEADEPELLPEPARDRRTVYILHSGLHTILSDPSKNIAAAMLKVGLEKRGVDARDLVVLENPYPTASWKSAFPLESMSIFMESTDPSSRVSHDSFRRMHKALAEKEVSADDQIIWVGHSAGGQMGITMAHLARNLWLYPDLLKDTSPYRFDMVITLGAPVASAHLPSEVKLRLYYSAEDRVVRLVSKFSPIVLYPLGYRARLNKLPQEIGGNGKIRCFCEVEHPLWDVDGRVLDRIVAETQRDYRPLWHSQLGSYRFGVSLSQVLCQAIEDQCHISVEDPPRGR